MRGGFPAPDGRVVHQVVADQRAGVQELDRTAHPEGGVRVGPGGRAAGGPVSPVDEGRAEALARTPDETAEHLVEGGDIGAKEVQFSEAPAEHRSQLRLDQLARPGHVGGCGGSLTDLHGHDPAILSAGSAGMPLPEDSARLRQTVACARPPARRAEGGRAGRRPGGGPGIVQGRRARDHPGMTARETSGSAGSAATDPGRGRFLQAYYHRRHNGQAGAHGTAAWPRSSEIRSSRLPGNGRLRYPSDYE